MHFERGNAFQNAENYIFLGKNKKKRYLCLPYLKVSDLLPKHTYFLFGLNLDWFPKKQKCCCLLQN